MAAAPGPPIGAAAGLLAGPLAAGAPLSKFLDFYSDASRDEFNRQYSAVMAVFQSLPGGPSPQQIRELVVNNPRESTLGFATLVVVTPGHQGLIYAIHSLSKFATRLGQPATQWDDRILKSPSVARLSVIRPSIFRFFPFRRQQLGTKCQCSPDLLSLSHDAHLLLTVQANIKLRHRALFSRFCS
jgi:hypothetical protein